jgi:hypothetical protein
MKWLFCVVWCCLQHIMVCLDVVKTDPRSSCHPSPPFSPYVRCSRYLRDELGPRGQMLGGAWRAEDDWRGSSLSPSVHPGAWRFPRDLSLAHTPGCAKSNHLLISVVKNARPYPLRVTPHRNAVTIARHRDFSGVPFLRELVRRFSIRPTK